MNKTKLAKTPTRILKLYFVALYTRDLVLLYRCVYTHKHALHVPRQKAMCVFYGFRTFSLIRIWYFVCDSQISQTLFNTRSLIDAQYSCINWILSNSQFVASSVSVVESFCSRVSLSFFCHYIHIYILYRLHTFETFLVWLWIELACSFLLFPFHFT